MTRLLLIPEDLFAALTAQSVANDGSPVQMIKSRMNKIVGDQTIDADERAMKYDQEFKRFNKLTREREEQPVNVRLQNLEEIANAVSTTAAEPSPPISAIIDSTKKKRTRKNPLNIKNKRIVKKKPRPLSNGAKDPPQQVSEEAQPSTSTKVDVASPPHTRSKDPPAGGRGIEKNLTLTREGVLQYIYQNSEELGINEKGQILRGGTGHPLVTSNLQNIVDYLLSGTERTRFKNTPVGYAEFIARANQHPLLVKYFFPEQYKKQQQQQGKGVSFSSFKKVNKNVTKSRAVSNSSSFSFKPSLWR